MDRRGEGARRVTTRPLPLPFSSRASRVSLHLAFLQAHQHQRCLEQQQQRDGEDDLRPRIGRRHHGCDHENADDHVTPRARHLRPRDDPGAVQQQQQHRQQEREPEGEDELHHQIEIFARARQCLHRQPACFSAVPEEEPERGRHHHEIGERRAAQEQHRGGDQERQKRLLLTRIQPRREKRPQLVGDHRKADHEARKQRDLQLDEEHFGQFGEDQLALAIGERLLQRPHQKTEDLVGEIEAHPEPDRQRQQRADDAGAQFDQMIEQRRAGFVEVINLEHRRFPYAAWPAGFPRG